MNTVLHFPLRVPILAVFLCAQLWVAAAWATPLGSTRDDFEAPGTQPLSLTDPISTPDQCVSCHSNYGQPQVEPMRAWQGSMMAQSGRDPMMWAALAVANQLAPHAGETCLRCHLPKGWLEGRSVPEDGTEMTAADRHGVQCGLCHRLVDPIADPGNPAPDAAILAGLADPVPAFSNAMMVVDPLDRLRGPFDIVADLGTDPHAPARSTLVSPYHRSSELCGTCHNLRNPMFTRNPGTGEYELNVLATPSSDVTQGFPEQSTYDEWLASEYASTGVLAPQFGGNRTIVSECQDCHMPAVTGKDANLGLTRNDVPHHTFAGANTFIPAVLPSHPAFGAEVDATILNEGIAHSTAMLRKAATLEASLGGGNLTVRVTNESGHKLPTGYPEGRRMWLHVRAMDAGRQVVLESGRYVTATRTLLGHSAEPMDPDYDPHLHVWESEMGISPAVAALVGLPAGKSFHLALNNIRLKDNRIPPRGFTNAAYDAFDGEPVGATYADGQYWDEVVYPAAGAVQAEVTLYYQTASREYVEFLRDENTTTASGAILFDLYDQVNPSTPVVMARAFVESDARVTSRCRKQVAKAQARYRKSHYREWSRCYQNSAQGLSCDAVARDTRLAAEAAKLRSKIGGTKDKVCAGKSLTPSSIGHGSTCPAPCAHLSVFDLGELATCSMCLADALNRDTLEAAYGSVTPALPGQTAGSFTCQKTLDQAAGGLADRWARALERCEADNASGRNDPPVDCNTDPGGKIAAAKSAAGARISRCADFTGLEGCGAEANAAAVQSCVETAIGAVVEGYTEGAYR